MYGVPTDVDWTFLLRRELMQVCVGLYDVQLRFDGDVSISVTSAFQTGLAQSLHDWSAGETRGAEGAFPFLKQTTSRVAASADRLEIEFANGGTITIFDDDPHYETFTITGPDGVIVV